MPRPISISASVLLAACGSNGGNGGAGTDDASVVDGAVVDAEPQRDAGAPPDAEVPVEPGTLQFAIQIDSERANQPRLHGLAIVPLAGGDLLAVGDFEGQMVLAPGTAQETTLQSSAGSLDGFVARFRGSNGALEWANVIGADGIDVMGGAAALADGGAVVGIALDGEVVLGAGETGETTVSGTGNSSHLVRYGADGEFVWATRMGGDIGGLAEAPDGSIVATGRIGTGGVFGQGEPNETALEGTPVGATFFARFNSNGTLAWARAAGPSGGRAAAALSDSSAVFAGILRFGSVFGEGEPNETTLPGGGGQPDIFFARYLPDGSVAWARQLVGAGQEFPTALATHGNGFLLAGEINVPVTFGMGANATTIDPASAGGGTASTGFFARYDTDGRLDWVEGIYPTDADSGAFDPGAAATANGGAALSASFSGNIRIGEMQRSSTGARDVFLARYEPNRTTAWTRQLRGNGSIENAGVIQLDGGAICVAGTFEGTVELEAATSETLAAQGIYDDLFVACYEP